LDTESASAEKESDTEIIVDRPTAGIEDAVITEVTEETIDIDLSPYETEPPLVAEEDQDIDTSASIDEPDNEESAVSEDIIKALHDVSEAVTTSSSSNEAGDSATKP
jgi:hypothetical protein